MPTIDIQVPMITKKVKPALNSTVGSHHNVESAQSQAATHILFKHLTSSSTEKFETPLEKKKLKMLSTCL